MAVEMKNAPTEVGAFERNGGSYSKILKRLPGNIGATSVESNPSDTSVRTALESRMPGLYVSGYTGFSGVKYGFEGIGKVRTSTAPTTVRPMVRLIPLIVPRP
jgi:hypothetical protein